MTLEMERNSCEEKLLEWLKKRDESLRFSVVTKADISFKTSTIRSAIFNLLEMGEIEITDDYKITVRERLK